MFKKLLSDQIYRRCPYFLIFIKKISLVLHVCLYRSLSFAILKKKLKIHFLKQYYSKADKSKKVRNKNWNSTPLSLIF